jgi:hypothetical protein
MLAELERLPTLAVDLVEVLVSLVISFGFMSAEACQYEPDAPEQKEAGAVFVRPEAEEPAVDNV